MKKTLSFKRILSIVIALSLVSQAPITTIAVFAAESPTPANCGTLPDYGVSNVSITLNESLTQSILDGGTKDIKYANNTVQVDSRTFTDVEIKGRGNTTWKEGKKPYQIKFSSKENLFGMGSAKKWVLLANSMDGTGGVRFDVARKLATDIGIPHVVDHEPVSLFINCEYRGLYTIGEKNEVGKVGENHGVPLVDAEGVMIELNNIQYAAEDPQDVKKDKYGNYYVIAESKADDMGEADSKAEIGFTRFIDNMNSFQAALASKNWTALSDIIDVDSFLKYYLVNEFLGNYDGIKASFYMYQDGASDKIHFGPIWDFDISMGNSWGDHSFWDYGSDFFDYSPNQHGLSTWAKKLVRTSEFTSMYETAMKVTYKQALINTITYARQRSVLIDTALNANYQKWPRNVTSFNGTFILNSNEKNLETLTNYLEMRVCLKVDASLCPEQPVADGVYTIETISKANMVVDIAGASTANAANIQLWSSNNTQAQAYYFKYNAETGNYTITNIKSKKALDVSGGSVLRSANVQQYTNNDSCAQQWRLSPNPNGSFEILSACSGKALDISGGSKSNGANIQIWGRNGSVAQQWNLISMQSIADGEYVLYSQLGSEKVFDVSGGGKINGVKLNLWSSNNTGAQRFTVKYNSNSGYYTLINPQSNKVVDAVGGGTGNGTAIQIYGPNGTCAQQWQFVKKGDSNYYEIINTCSAKAIDVEGGGKSNGAKIQLYSRNGTAAQGWRFEPA